MPRFSASCGTIYIALASFLMTASAAAFEPLIDHFDTPADKPDAALWSTIIGPGSFLGDTQLDPWTARAESHFPAANGALRLTVESFNPSGFSWWGKHIQSRREFQPTADTAIEITFRMRIVGDFTGVVHSGYLYGCRDPATCATRHDEIDLEVIKGRDGVATLVANVYADEPLGLGRPIHMTPAGWDPAAFNDYRITWSRTKIAFHLNGRLLTTYDATRGAVPIGPMQFNAIAWVPSEEAYARVYSPLRRPTRDPATSEVFAAEIDAVSVREVSTVAE